MSVDPNGYPWPVTPPMTTPPDDPRADEGLEELSVAALADALAQVSVLRQALKPFAECAEQIGEYESDEEWAKFRLVIGDYRRAAEALSTTPALTAARSHGGM